MSSLIRHDFDVERATADELRAYVYDLEDAVTTLAPVETDAKVIALRHAFPKLSPTQTRLVILLSDGRTRTKQAITDWLYSDRPAAVPKIVDVYICKARAALKGSRIEIKTHWALGYQLIDGQGELKRILAGEGVAA